MRKIVLLLGIAFCLASAETIQGVFCRDEIVYKCIGHYMKQCNDKNYATCAIVGELEREREEYRNAIKYYELACEKANIETTYKIKLMNNETIEMSNDFIPNISCNILGSLYNFGEGVRQDYSKAMQYYKKSCDLGSGDGCYSMAMLYYWGSGVQKDLKRAIKLWTKSCELENASGCGILGAIYTDGEYVKQSFSKAKELYGKACDLGYQLGCDEYRKLNEMNIK